MIAARSPIVRVGIRAATPIALLTGIYLLFAGHNQPGGGFAAGLVFGVQQPGQQRTTSHPNQGDGRHDAFAKYALASL